MIDIVWFNIWIGNINLRLKEDTKTFGVNQKKNDEQKEYSSKMGLISKSWAHHNQGSLRPHFLFACFIDPFYHSHTNYVDRSLENIIRSQKFELRNTLISIGTTVKGYYLVVVGHGNSYFKRVQKRTRGTHATVIYTSEIDVKLPCRVNLFASHPKTSSPDYFT